MLRSWKLGRVAGIDLYLHPTFLLLPLAAYLLDGGLISALFILAVFGCVLLHELGHALTARGYGIRTEDITLYPIGGVARLERMPRSAGAELLITLAGPAVNIAIAGFLGMILSLAAWLNPGGSLTLVGQFVQMLMSVNLALAAFNMIPAFPMDGGRVLRALLSGWLGRLRATEIASSVGQVVALALPLAMISLGTFHVLHILLAAFVFFAARMELEQVRSEEFARSRPISRPVFADQGIWTAPPGYTWVNGGNGRWRLTPIVIPVSASDRYPYGGSTSWRRG